MKSQWLGYCHPIYNPDEPKWCYFKENGKEAMDWTQIDGNWYNFGGGGTMITGWYRTDGNYYYFDPVTGIMQTSGTAMRDGVTYEFQPDGLSQKIDGLLIAEAGDTDGWVEENGIWYYLRDGQKVMNEWLQDGDNSYYVGEDGAMYTGSHIMDGCLYMFSWNGRLMKDGKQTYSNGVKYVFDGTGRGVPAEMNAEERMRYSASTIWCEMTYEKSTLFRKCVAFCLLGSIPNPLKNLSNLICLDKGDLLHFFPHYIQHRTRRFCRSFEEKSQCLYGLFYCLLHTTKFVISFPDFHYNSVCFILI
ncbi:hypothetical protein [Clostridium sp. AN503]|uniref:N-acetylmuramoyl-L-alanine amidase family protein n=1 Tax=Clostridium sp. AN503 TaxID=3160598 RepID=UPI0034580962